jgi:hypothetical protein
MKAKPLILALLLTVLGGVLAWRFAAPGGTESLAADVGCIGGQCALKRAAASQPAGVPPATVEPQSGSASEPAAESQSETASQPGRLDVPWPPRLGQPYPDLTLIDQTGQPVRLSSFKGSVILIEPIGMTCPACQAFSGAHRRGALGGITPQPGLPSIAELLPRFSGGLSLSDDRIIFVQILFYNLSMEAPSPDDARRWAEHFGLDRSKNHVVLAGTKELMGDATFKMIPGFHLVDRDFVFRADSAGHNPPHDLVRVLLPMVRQLVAAPSIEQSTRTARPPRSLSDIEAAYRAIPHRRTVFDVEAAGMSPAERAYLRRLFNLVDLGIVHRVETLTWLRSNRTPEPSAEDYERTQNQLNALAVPPRLAGVHRLVAEAMREQRAALEEWRKTAVPADLPRHPLVASSSNKLHRAYAELLALFPQEGAHNKTAFFDYLCALDFI